MKEEEFKEKIEWKSLTAVVRKLFVPNLEIPIHYVLDDNGDVVVDFEEMEDEFKDKLKHIEEVLEDE
jgi:hypothetical protein